MHQTIPQTLRRWISSGNGGAGGTVWKAEEPGRVAGQRGQELAVGLEHLVGFLDRPERRAADDLRDRVRLERELGHDAEVAAAAAQRPEEVGVLVGARGHRLPVREDDLGAEQVVDREAVRAREVSHPSAERQAADAGRRDDAARNGEPVLVRRRVDLAPGGAAADADGSRPRGRPRPSAGARGPRPRRRRRCRGRRRCGRRRGPRAAGRGRARSRSTRATSSGLAARAISAGRLSIIALNRARASSYCGSSGPINSPSKAPPSSRRALSAAVAFGLMFILLAILVVLT